MNVFYSFFILLLIIILSCGTKDFQKESLISASAIDNDGKIILYKVKDKNEEYYPLIIIGSSSDRQRGYRLRCDDNDGLDVLLKTFGFNQQKYLSAIEIREVDIVLWQTKVHENPELNCKTQQSVKLYRVDNISQSAQYYIDFGKSISGKRIAHMAGCEELISAIGKKSNEAIKLSATEVTNHFETNDEFNLNCNIKNRIVWVTPSGETANTYETAIDAQVGKSIKPLSLFAVVRDEINFLTQYRIVSNNCGNDIKLEQELVANKIQGKITGKIANDFSESTCEVLVEAFVANAESQYPKNTAKIKINIADRLYWLHQDRFIQTNLENLDEILPISLAAKARNDSALKVSYALEPINCKWLRLDPINQVVRGRVPKYSFLKNCKVRVNAFVSNQPEIEVLSGIISLEINNKNKSEPLFSIGLSHTLALMPDGSMWGWGSNSSGQIGNESSEEVKTPVQIGVDHDWASIHAGWSFNVALKKDGSLWSWGDNSLGQLGLGILDRKVTKPMQIGSSKDWKMVAIGARSVVALKKDGTIFQWGHLFDGRVNGVSKSVFYSPTKVGLDSDWKFISNGNYFSSQGNPVSAAIKNDGSLWMWGYGYLLGDNSTNSYLAPILIDKNNIWNNVQIGFNYASAINSKGTLFRWGIIEEYRILNSPTSYLDSNIWQSIFQGNGNVFALKKDGTLWVWGNVSRLTAIFPDVVTSDHFIQPVKINNDQDWKTLYYEFDRNIITKNDGSIWMNVDFGRAPVLFEF